MITMMKSCLVKQGNTEEDGDEGVKDLIEMTLKKMDHDKDGKLTKEEMLFYYKEGEWEEHDDDKNEIITWDEFLGPKGKKPPDYRQGYKVELR